MFSGLTAGTIWIYRPVDGLNIFPVEVYNSTKSRIALRIGTTNYTIQTGATQVYQVPRSNGSVGFGITYPTITTGKIGTSGAEIGSLEGERVYTITNSRSPRPGGWGSSIRPTDSHGFEPAQ